MRMLAPSDERGLGGVRRFVVTSVAAWVVWCLLFALAEFKPVVQRRQGRDDLRWMSYS
jgi:hypothetical protein